MPKHKFNEQIETAIISKVVDGEYRLAARNNQFNYNDFENYVDMFDSVRTEKKYRWQSNISIPEFASQMLTQSSIDAALFKTRDFVEAYVEDETDEAVAAAEAQKELINRTLNQKHIHHYQKYMRGKNVCNIAGHVYFHAWWEQKTKKGVIGKKTRTEELDVDIYGNPITDPENQTPAQRHIEEDVIGDIAVVDRFNYDVIDERNVFTDNKYVYSLQEKDWIILRTERTLRELKREAKEKRYFNLHLLEEINPAAETDTSQESYNKYDKFEKKDNDKNNPYDVLKRYGKFWCKIKKRDETGYPVEVEPGIDPLTGVPLKNAEFLEIIMTFVVSGGSSVLIGFQTTPYLDAQDNPYRPIFRGLCYIHPVNDAGAGDGRYARELQVGINDTFNISNDRVMMATMPALKVRKYALEDTPEILIKPGYNIPVANPDDVIELQIKDDIQGALQQVGMLTGKMQQTTSIYPTTMGNLPQNASTTATAVAGAETRANDRSNYKALTYENTAMSELYWMISQMTFRFAKPETGIKLMGQKVYDFNPWRDDYYYKPVSQTIETEYGKQNKIRMWVQILGYIGQIQHPDIVKQINYILNQIYKYMGDEFVNFGDKMLDQTVPVAGGGEQPGALSAPASNQSGIPQSLTEIGARESQASPIG